MITFSEAHIVEQATFIVSMIAVVLWSCLLWMKIRDIRDNTENGPIRFMLNDNRTFGIIMLLVSLGSFCISIIALNLPPDKYDYEVMSQSWHAMMFMATESVLFCVLALYRFRRRRKLPQLINEHKSMLVVMHEALPGGSRKTDPPAETMTDDDRQANS